MGAGSVNLLDDNWRLEESGSRRGSGSYGRSPAPKPSDRKAPTLAIPVHEGCLTKGVGRDPQGARIRGGRLNASPRPYH